MRRALLATAALAVIGMLGVRAQELPRSVIYASVGPELTRYDVDVGRATLEKRESVRLPANVAEGWPHPFGRFLYVVWTSETSRLDPGGDTGSQTPRHGVSAFRIDPASGTLVAHGEPVSLSAPASYVTVDPAGRHLLVAHGNPSGITVHQLRPDGTIGAAIAPSAPLDVGFQAHCIRVDPSGTTVIVPTRGRYDPDPASGRPGALKLFSYKDGVLTNRSSIVPPGGGAHFQARHLDFHPSHRWLFLTLENQNKLVVYGMSDGNVSSAALFTKDTLAPSGAPARPFQIASTVHVHPNGRFVYVGNRSTDTENFNGRPVHAGGENSIAAYAIDQKTGEPKLIQSVETRGFSPRTFALDPAGRILVVANQAPLAVKDGSTGRVVAAGLSVFRVEDNGTLAFARKYDVETVSRSLGWMGLVALPSRN